MMPRTPQAGGGPKIHPRDFTLSGVEPKIHLQLLDMQREYDLTNLEMIEILHNFTSRRISHLIKHEHEEYDAAAAGGAQDDCHVSR